MKAYITDIQGSLIEVTDLQQAITQVADYINFLYENPTPSNISFQENRRKYWKDIFQKLGKLKLKQ